jgi:DNA-binding transcriptional LysR family regulator
MEAPLVRLRFVPKVTKDSAGLRDGSVDLESGVVGLGTSPELMQMTLFRDRFVGAVRKRHPLNKGRITPARYASGQHVAVSRRGIANGPVDAALEPLGLARQIVAVVGGYSSALALARVTDLIATVPERHTAGLRDRMHSFPLPFVMPSLTVSMLWHPRMHADPVHEWFRRCVQEICAEEDRRR